MKKKELSVNNAKDFTSISTNQQNNTYKNNQTDKCEGAGGLAWLGYRLDMDTNDSVSSSKIDIEDPNFWSCYEQYLLNNVNRRTALDRINYARKYYYILVNANAREILTLSNEKRVHVMKALSSLSKYIGCYERWTDIIKNYHLRWSNENGLDIFRNIMIDEDKSYNTMLEWLKNCLHVTSIAKEYRNILLFTTLTCLRPSEALQSIKLIKQDKDKYLNKNKMLLEHFKFPQFFIRPTKKAYISIANDSIIELAINSASLNSYMSLVSGIKRNNSDYSINSKYCRKIFETYLRQNGIEQEMIDLLQGRIPKSIFVRHYYRPDLDAF